MAKPLQSLLFSELVEAPTPVNVASIPQRSPFRYPGGKTWFVPRLREWLKSMRSPPELLIEPFAGGGIISLTAAFENLTDRVLMVEKDADIAAVWITLMDGDIDWLAQKILNFEISKDAMLAALNCAPRTIQDKAFQTILKNRTFHGGILAPGASFLKQGEAGKGLASRWYPKTLARRLQNIKLIRNKIRFEQGDAFAVMARFQQDKKAVFFVDPPYTAGGKKAGNRLYTHFEVDHDALFRTCASLQGDFIMTYDHAPEVLALAQKYGLAAKPIPMKNTHHAEMTELVIGRDLAWMSDVDCVLEVLAPGQ